MSKCPQIPQGWRGGGVRGLGIDRAIREIYK